MYTFQCITLMRDHASTCLWWLCRDGFLIGLLARLVQQRSVKLKFLGKGHGFSEHGCILAAQSLEELMTRLGCSDVRRIARCREHTAHFRRKGNLAQGGCIVVHVFQSVEDDVRAQAVDAFRNLGAYVFGETRQQVVQVPSPSVDRVHVDRNFARAAWLSSCLFCTSHL